MYAWAGGNQYGPTRGVCAGDGAWNDCNIIGFDCSGLVMYAWGPYISLAHYAATQYTQAGSYHPGPGNFQPGDLLFFGKPAYHVAIYAGNNQLIESPEPGKTVHETAIYQTPTSISRIVGSPADPGTSSTTGSGAVSAVTGVGSGASGWAGVAGVSVTGCSLPR